MHMRRLQAAREERSWTRAQEGYEAQVYPALIGQIELGRLSPPPGSVVLARLAAALNFPDDPACLLDEVAD
jgi:transcriptional regulator with XRE-family HTH domain